MLALRVADGMTEPVLETNGLSKTYLQDRGFLSRKRDEIVAVDGVNIAIQRGESFGLVGESGCGKSTLARMLMRLIEPSNGSMRVTGVDPSRATRLELRALRTKIQMVFQDPYASLNPRHSIYRTLAKPYRLNGGGTKALLRARVVALLDDVGLSPAAEFLDRHPHELSGGQRQRVVIARAIALGPDLVVADEPVSALDVSVRAQILNLLNRLKATRKLTLLFISHDLSVVRSLCDRVAVMYLGRIVESGSVEDVFERPLHPYTRALLDSTPVLDPIIARTRAEISLEGEVPSASARPPGCSFHPRCPRRSEGCDRDQPSLRRSRSGREVACHYADL